MDLYIGGIHARKAVGGGTHLSVDLSYQVSPNMSTKYVLYSKSDWLAYGYLTVVLMNLSHFKISVIFLGISVMFMFVGVIFRSSSIIHVCLCD